MTPRSYRRVESERFRRIADIVVNSLCLAIVIAVLVVRARAVWHVESSEPAAASNQPMVELIETGIDRYYQVHHALPDRLEEIAIANSDQWKYEKTGPRSYRLGRDSEDGDLPFVIRSVGDEAR